MNMSKTSIGTDADPDWNTFSGYVGTLYLSGRVNGAAQTIGGTSYTGFTRIGGTGGTQTTLSTATGYYALTPTPVTIFQLNNSTAPYTGEYIRTTAAAGSATDLTLSTTWVSDGSGGGAGTSSNISGGTGVTSPATSIGAATAPTTLCTYIPPSTTYLTNTWGTPTIGAAAA